jgi:hypothetical protein
MLTSFFKSLTCVGCLWSRPFAQLSLFGFPFWFRLVRVRVYTLVYQTRTGPERLCTGCFKNQIAMRPCKNGLVRLGLMWQRIEPELTTISRAATSIHNRWAV